jgi:prolyl oligopeptidase
LSATCAWSAAGCAAKPRPQPPPTESAEAAAARDRAQVAGWNRDARAGAVVERVADLEVSDPYRALEQDSALTRAWIAAQTERTRRALRADKDPTAERRLTELMSIGSLEGVAIAGARTLLLRREGGREQPALYALDGDKLPDTPQIDPAQFGAHAALDWFFLSPGGRYVAFGVSDNGDERSTLRVYDLARGALLPDAIGHTKWCNLAWLNDESGFYYTRYPRAGEPRFDAAQPDSYFPRLFFHRLGADPHDDALVFQSELPSDMPNPVIGDDDRYLIIANYRSFTASDVYIVDRDEDPRARVVAPDARHPLHGVVVGLDKQTSGAVHQDELYLLTNEGAPRRRIVMVAPDLADGPSSWHQLIPEGKGTIETFCLLHDAIVVHAIEDVRSRLLLYGLDGTPAGEVALPEAGSVADIACDPRGNTLAFTFSSFVYPPALFRYDAPRRALTRVHQVAHDLDASAFVVDRQQVASADGTPVNVYYVHGKALRRDGEAKVLLTGYGGFDVSLLPQFTRSALYFIERGGVYAVANLRGGGEGGEAWHRAGMREQKPRVFEDFEAVVRWFAQSGISRPQRIAITGGSNGGLLMGALLTRAPDAFGAAVAYVGLYDMLRYPLFPPAQLWTGEYGDPREPEAARYLYAYSPYHRVVDGTHYPAALIETADHDTRVHFGHSAKFAARLQDAQAGPQPIYFYQERDLGHGRGTPLRALVQRYSRMYAFLDAVLK